MRILPIGPLLLCFAFVASLPAVSQDSASTPAVSSSDPAQSGPSISPQAPTTFEDVIDHVVEKEHLFLAHMRHMRPMVGTYLQDMKSDSAGKAEPVKDQYFLGRLDMNEGPEDTSFIGQPGFRQRMLNRLTGVYSTHFLPLGFAQMVVLDTDFQKKYYNFSFVRREFLGEVRCLVIDVEPRAGEKIPRFKGRIWVED